MGASDSAPRRVKGVVRDRSGNILDCVFCNIVREAGYGQDEISADVSVGKLDPGLRASGEAEVIFGDSDVVVFRSRGRMASQHLLAVPTSHIDNVDSLGTREDVNLLRNMRAKGLEALAKLGVEDYTDVEFRFHVPPSNSIDHLHMHIFKPPYCMKGKLLYQWNPWAETADEIISKIERNLSKLEETSVNSE